MYTTDFDKHFSLQGRCIDPVVVHFHDINVFVTKFWYIYSQKLFLLNHILRWISFCIFDLFPVKICSFATIAPFFAVILTSSIRILIVSVSLLAK